MVQPHVGGGSPTLQCSSVSLDNRRWHTLRRSSGEWQWIQWCWQQPTTNKYMMLIESFARKPNVQFEFWSFCFFQSSPPSLDVPLMEYFPCLCRPLKILPSWSFGNIFSFLLLGSTRRECNLHYDLCGSFLLCCGSCIQIDHVGPNVDPALVHVWGFEQWWCWQ